MDNAIVFSSTIEEIQRNIQRLKTRSMRAVGLGLSDMNCLMMLKKHPEGLNSTELSRHCHLDKALISRTVQKLLKKGIVDYEHPRLPADLAPVEEGVVRRGAYRVPLRLTDEGQQLAQSLYGVAGEAASYVAQDISAEEMSIFFRTLEKVGSNLKEFLQTKCDDQTCEEDVD